MSPFLVWQNVWKHCLHPISSSRRSRHVWLKQIGPHLRHSISHTVIHLLAVKRRWLRRHHSSNRLFFDHSCSAAVTDWTAAPHRLPGKLGQIEQVNMWRKGFQQQREVFKLMWPFSLRSASHLCIWHDPFFYQFPSPRVRRLDWFYKVPVGNQQLSCVCKCFVCCICSVCSVQWCAPCGSWYLCRCGALAVSPSELRTQSFTLLAMLQVTGSEHTHTPTHRLLVSRFAHLYTLNRLYSTLHLL